MNKMLVAVFETEASAFEGLSALRELHQEGDITLYASAVVVKDKAGKNEVKQAADQGPVGTAVGLVTGSLIGLLAALPDCSSAPRWVASAAWLLISTAAASARRFSMKSRKSFRPERRPCWPTSGKPG